MDINFIETSTFDIGQDLKSSLEDLSKKQEVTLFVMLLTAFKVLLFKYSYQDDICAATPTPFFTNILALRSKVNGDDTFGRLLQQVKKNTDKAYFHKGISFGDMVDSIKSNDPKATGPLYQYMFVLQNIAGQEIYQDQFNDIKSKFGLIFSITQMSDALLGSVSYSNDSFNEELVTRMIRHYNNLLYSIVRHPQQKVMLLPMINSEERNQLLFQFNDTAIEYPKNKTLIDLFEEQAEINPDNAAIVFKEEKLTYRQLNERANQLARYLQSKGIKEEVPVPICIERSADMIVGILGILKAGGAYVPIDPEFPEERIKFIVQDTGAKVVVSNKVNKTQLSSSGAKFDIVALDETKDIGRLSTDNLANTISPHQLAYIIYTSGSTGVPKGVMTEHKSIFNYLVNSKAKFIKSEGTAGSFIHFPFTFDASLKSLFTPLISGKLIVISSKKSAFVFEDSNLHKYAPYDFIQLTPAHLDFFYAEFLKAPKAYPLTGKLSIGGEALYWDHLNPLIEKGVEMEIANEYGPTEATVACTGYSFNTAGIGEKVKGPLPIGKPINNVRVYILDEFYQLAPLGAPGEICVGGEQVARGYLNQPELTEKKFIADPYSDQSGARIYKTGDLGRWLPDGNIEYLGRIDDQVKIRGFRIEPGEIESILITSEMISQVAVVARENQEGKNQLIAYVVPDKGFNKKTIVAYLQNKLPYYMIPDIWVELEKFPLTHNRKIDKNALPDPDTAHASSENYTAPRTENERIIAQIWQEVLGITPIGAFDHFFDSGGHSLLALKVLKKVENLTGKKLQVSNLFEFPTVEKFASLLQEDKKASKFQSLIPLRATGKKDPLYIVTGINGTAFVFIDFANRLDEEQPVYIVQEPQKSSDLEEFPDNVEEIAAFYLAQLTEQNPDGPYLIAGHSSGGIIAYEMAKQLEKMGKEVRQLILFDTFAHKINNLPPGIRRSLYTMANGVGIAYIKLHKNIQLFRYNSKLALFYRKQALKNFTKRLKKAISGNRNTEKYEFSEKVTEMYEKAIAKYRITPYNKDMVLFRATISSFGGGKHLGWRRHVKSLEIHQIEGEHINMLASKYLGPAVQQVLDKRHLQVQ